MPANSAECPNPKELRGRWARPLVLVTLTGAPASLWNRGATSDGDFGRLLGETGGHPGCTMLLARACARVGAGYEVTTATLDLVLPEVRADEMWRLLDPGYDGDDGPG